MGEFTIALGHTWGRTWCAHNPELEALKRRSLKVQTRHPDDVGAHITIRISVILHGVRLSPSTLWLFAFNGSGSVVSGGSIDLGLTFISHKIYGLTIRGFSTSLSERCTTGFFQSSSSDVIRHSKYWVITRRLRYDRLL